MRVDLGNALSAVASPGVSEDALQTMDARVASAHDRIEAERAAGTFGYEALSLPDRIDTGRIERVRDRFETVDSVLTVGIGGSALGAATVTDALGVENHLVLDNVDPAHVRAVLDTVEFETCVVHVVSKSGTTTETLANFLTVREAFERAGVDWRDRTVVTTGEEGPLRGLAATHDLPTCAVPSGVPGRFSVLSPVGLVAPALLGADVEAVTSGAATVADRLSGSLYECPPYAYAATAVALERRGASTNVMMPYAESLETFAEWFAQLWAESLGKDGMGQTPVRALGATDQHSQLQLYRDGRRNTVVSFLRPHERESQTVPPATTDELSHLGGGSLESIIDAEFRATEASLAEAGRPSVRLEIDRVDAAGLGELLFSMEAACVMAGELHGVDPFDQPAVEWGKRATRDLLAGRDTEATRAVESKTRLTVD